MPPLTASMPALPPPMPLSWMTPEKTPFWPAPDGPADRRLRNIEGAVVDDGGGVGDRAGAAERQRGARIDGGVARIGIGAGQRHHGSVAVDDQASPGRAD